MVRLWTAIVATLAIITVGMAQDAAATSSTVVIDAVRAGTPASATEEFVKLRNVGAAAVDISGWKVVYTSASGGTSTTLVTVTSLAPDHVLLPGGVSETLFSNNLAASLVLDASAITFTPGLSAAGGTISLRDPSGTVIDQVGWGTATQFEGRAAPALGTQILQRTSSLDDTDDNFTDFALVGLDQTIDLVYGGLVDVTDVCSNIDGIQDMVPEGLVGRPDGTCGSPDACSNLDGIQMEVPAGYRSEAGGTCSQIDLCDNIDGIQTDTTGYEVVGTTCSPLFIPTDIRLSELLPNPQGADTGNEFIELYNASDETVSLDDYRLRIGDKLYAFPAGVRMSSGEYAVFSDTELNVTFANASGKAVELVGRDGSLIDTLPVYTNAPDDQSWALINGEWQYTNQPTPGAANQASSVLGSGSTTSGSGTLAPCPAGKYRNPATNRCKAYETASTLTPCQPGQERNPATNRCRSVTATTASLVPCKEGQERNPETNRCRKIATASTTLKPCAAGQERNPDTNRCRKVASATVAEADFPVEPVKDTTSTFAAWWALGGVVALGAGYAGWEYRHGLTEAIKRVIPKGKS